MSRSSGRAALCSGLLLIALGCQSALVEEAKSAPPVVKEAAPEGMVRIPGGKFMMGSSDSMFPDAQPVHEVEVDAFWMDTKEVTNDHFAAFVSATGYKTVAERSLDAKDYPTATPNQLKPSSIVFSPPDSAVDLNDPSKWWKLVAGADWKHPEGPDSSLEGKADHPVVHVAFEDAVAYCKWANKRLPTEAEWERAARGGQDQRELVSGGTANIFQGVFPHQNSKIDGYALTSPVGHYGANEYGLYDMAGNVWEWCADWYRPDAYLSGEVTNPVGPTSSRNRNAPGVPMRVQRGGSFLCADSYCVRFRVGARGKGAMDSSWSNVGFRCVR